MLKRNNLPERKPFSFTGKHILDDIEVICANKEQVNQLFICLDEKPPQEQKFSQMEEFLKGTNNLEDVQETLQALVEEVDTLSKDISESINDIKARIATVEFRKV